MSIIDLGEISDNILNITEGTTEDITDDITEDITEDITVDITEPNNTVTITDDIDSDDSVFQYIGGAEDVKYYEDLINRKEFLFYKLKKEPAPLPDIAAGRYLKLNSYQYPIRNFISPHFENRRLFITHKPGCHPAGTLIYTPDFYLKKAEKFNIGDYVLGDDYKPRKVLEVIQGRGLMYRVCIGSREFLCNQEHIITITRGLCGTLEDITVNEYLARGTSAAMLCVKITLYNHTHKPEPQIYMYAEKFTISATDITADYFGFVLDGNQRYIVATTATNGKYGPDEYGLPIGVITHNSGKTISAITAAMPYIDIYKSEYNKLSLELRKKSESSRQLRHDLDRLTPSVYIVGFSGTVAAFIRDLLRYPEFGFITHEEKAELARRQQISLKAFSDYFNRLKHRITTKYKGGFFKFYGYQVLVNKLFISDKYKLIDIDADYKNRAQKNPDIQYVDVIAEYVRDGKITINMNVLDGFKNSFFIFDEFHHAYNSAAKNNYGAIIQYVLDSVPNIRALFITATVFNNSAFEIIDVMQFITGKKYLRADFFKGKEFKPGALEAIGREIAGKVSFIQDVDMTLFPEVILRGERMKIPNDIEVVANQPEFRENDEDNTTDDQKTNKGDIDNEYSQNYHLPYLKFIKCPMSKLHQETLNAAINKTGTNTSNTNTSNTTTEAAEADSDAPDIYTDDLPDDDHIDKLPPYSYHKIPPDGYTLFDGVFPNPDSTHIGLYHSSDIRALQSAPSNWQDSIGITIQPYTQQNILIGGDFLRAANIGKYFPKHKKMLDICDEIFTAEADTDIKCNKIMMYHSNVKNSGVLLIQETLKMNGFIDDMSNVRDDTRCAKCGVILSKHTKKISHAFIPARFLCVHADMSKSAVDDAIANFNANDNIWGEKYCLFVGSKLIRESYDFRCVRHFIIFNLTTNIPTLRQIFGRPNRKNSHEELPPKYRQLNIYLLITTVNTELSGKATARDKLSLEEYKYIDKMIDYIRIQQLECEINKNAFDGDIHREIIMSESLKQAYFPGKSSEPQKLFDALYYEPNIRAPEITDVNAGTISRLTFNAYRFYLEEIRLMTYLIKYRFIQNTIWKYDELWKAICSPPFNIEVNPKLFDENNFIITLANLTGGTARDIKNITEYNILGLFDYNDRIIYRKQQPHIIKHIGDYYILFPINSNTYTYNIDDVETYNRGINGTKNIIVDLNKYVRGNREAAKIAKYIEEITRISSNIDFNFLHFVATYDMNAQIKYVAANIEKQWKAIMNGSNNSGTIKTPTIIKEYADAGFVIYSDELRVYRDVVKQLSSKTVEKLRTSAPIGYVFRDSAEIYDAGVDRWIKINKIAINRIDEWREATMIGYLELYRGTLKFKMRKRLSRMNDGRLIEKGIVCEFKKKPDLLKIAEKIGVKIPDNKLLRRIESMCSIIRDHLIKSEIRERTKDSRIKYFYLWWDNLPRLELHFNMAEEESDDKETENKKTTDNTRTEEKNNPNTPENFETHKILNDDFTGGGDIVPNYRIYDIEAAEFADLFDQIEDI